MAVKIAPGNTDDRAPHRRMVEGPEGKLRANNEYIPQNLFANLGEKDLHLIPEIRRNMKNHLMLISDKTLL